MTLGNSVKKRLRSRCEPSNLAAGQSRLVLNFIPVKRGTFRAEQKPALKANALALGVIKPRLGCWAVMAIFLNRSVTFDETTPTQGAMGTPRCRIAAPLLPPYDDG